MARGGGGDGIVAMPEMNQPTRLCRRRAVVVELRWCCGELGAALGEAERAGGSESGRVNGVAGAWCLSACLGLTSQANAGMLLPCGVHGLWPVSHDAARVHVIQFAETD